MKHEDYTETVEVIPGIAVKRRTEIILEIDQVILARAAGASGLAWCEQCAREVMMVTPDQAAVITRKSGRIIYRWVETGHVHFIERGEGSLLICLDSLPTP